jgi:hypothetical protein
VALESKSVTDTKNGVLALALGEKKIIVRSNKKFWR